MPAPIRVLAVGNAYPPHHLGGYEIIWRGVMRHLQARGDQVRILTTDYRRPGLLAAEEEGEASEASAVRRELGWYWYEHEWRRLTPRARLRLERHNANAFDAQLDDLKPDVVTWWPLGGLSLGLVERARRRGIPALFFVLDPWLAYGPVHDQWHHMWRWPGGGLIDKLTGLPTRVDFAEAGRWIFCSETMREQVLSIRPEIADHAVLTPGVERAYLTAGERPDPRDWSWRLAYVGRVVEQKGVRTAIESMPLLPPEARLRIVGDGDRGYREELEQLARALGVDRRVEFEPARSRVELIDVYRASDAVVFPVLWAEPWGLVPLEAMALGRPVLASGRGGSGEYLEHGVNSLLFEAGNALSLAQEVKRVGEDRQLYGQLVTAGRRTAERYSEERFNQHAADEIDSIARG
jgi:glycosyltransferase involved in cell wall biosynthesis